MDTYNKRLELISTLADGLYHDVFCLLSVILGQADILKAELKSEIENEGSIRQFRSMNNISCAADDLTDYLKVLKNLTVTHDETEDISLKSFLSGLSYLMRGYAQKIRDRKNISIRMDFDRKTIFNFKIKRQEIFDIILPVIVNIFDNSARPGHINFESKSSTEKDYLIISFAKEMVGGMKLDELLQPVFGDHTMDGPDEDGIISYEFHNSSLSYYVDNNVYYIRFAKPFGVFNTSLTISGCKNKMG